MRVLVLLVLGTAAGVAAAVLAAARDEHAGALPSGPAPVPLTGGNTPGGGADGGTAQ